MAAIQRLSSFRVRGLLACSTERNPATMALLAETGMPLVIVDTCPPWHKGCFVGNDVAAAGEMAATHLLDVGCRQPAFLTAGVSLLHFSGFVALQRGFCRVLRRRRIAHPERRTLPAGLGIEDGREALRRARAAFPELDGVFCANDLCALGVMTAADEAGLRVGRDLAVMGIDDLSIGRLPRIGLTSIHQPHEQIARTAAQVLIDGIEQSRAPSGRQLFPPELIVRASTALG
ncbi:MAG: LacI family DNA-binding transcriptional regulator [Kiritimatiellae bacterium]|nr:LacI family DNA-binding transcriptional regulator [Kiritimatiellia bacterium]